MKNYTIRMEQPCDFKAVENLTREAFWNVYRPGCTEHYVLHHYRNNPSFIPELSLILEIDSEVIGHIMYAWSHIDANDGRSIRMMTFGPISIRPDYKRKGYGKILLDDSMKRAKAMGGKCLLIVGNIEFYGKSGFTPALNKGIRYADDPDAMYLLCKELNEGILDNVTGCYHDPEAYFEAEQNPDDFEKFEALFPKKEKLMLPGRLK